GQGFTYSTRCEPAFALGDVNTRTVFSVAIARGDGQADGARHADTRGTCGETHEGRGGCGVTIQRPGVQGHKERRGSGGVSAKAKQVLETQAVPVVVRQKLWRG